MSKQEQFADALEKFKNEAFEVGMAYPESRISRKYPFSKPFGDVIDDILAWYEDEREEADKPWQTKMAEQYKGYDYKLFGWNVNNNGGGFINLCKDYTCTDGITRMIQLNDESLGIYSMPYTEWIMTEIELADIWLEGSNVEYEDDIDGVLTGLVDYLTPDQLQDIKTGMGLYCGKYMNNY